MTGNEGLRLSESTRRTQAIFDEHEICNPDQERVAEYPFLEAPLRRCAERGGELWDVGAGRGYWFDHYRALGVDPAKITGVDLSTSAVEHLRGRGYRAVQADVANMDGIEDEVADLVLATGSLMVSEDTRRAFGHCVRMLRPGGELVVDLYNAYHPYFWFIHKLTWPLRTLLGRHYRGWWHPFLLAFQAQNYVRRGRFLNRADLEAVFFDQVMVPHAHLHRRREVIGWMEAAGLEVLGSGYNLGGSMFWVDGRRPEAAP